MTALLEVMLWIPAAAVAIPMTVVMVECWAALFRQRRDSSVLGERPGIAIVVPAHNEARGLARTLDSIRGQLTAQDRLIVIADNCGDNTARIARECGASVFERTDPAHCGKSYALAFAVRAMEEASLTSEIVIFFDADTTPEAGAIDALARAAFHHGRPVQGAYSLRERNPSLAQFAFALRNVVRPRGLQRLGLPCLLNGSGMAFPRSILRSVNLASGRIAEDRWLSVELAIAGHLTMYSPAGISGEFPLRAAALRTQRERWEHGHLETVAALTPRLIGEAMRQRRPALLALALELFVPPLALLAVMWSTIFLAEGLAAWLGASWAPAAFLLIAGILMGTTLATVGAELDAGFLSMARAFPRYVFSKLPLYAAFLLKRQTDWVATRRDETEND